ncbi:hypothetical protein MKW94_023925, partial [Papaver nudicaule]|nr:hypothetical protein [Papaver nudicaule]
MLKLKEEELEIKGKEKQKLQVELKKLKIFKPTVVYSMHQGKRDVETVLAMGIMEDVSIIPQPAG